MGSRCSRSTTPVVGASGAIFGLFGALLVVGRHIGANVTGIAVVIAINLGDRVPARAWTCRWQAHVGGLIDRSAGRDSSRPHAVARQRWLQIVLLSLDRAVLLALLARPPLFYF